MTLIVAMWTALVACTATQPQTQVPFPPAAQLAQVQPCVWPNKCKDTAVAAAPIQACVWPNKCKNEVQTAVVAQVQPCVWPNRCAVEETPAFAVN